MIRLQQWENGPYFTAFSLHVPDTPIIVRDIIKNWPRSLTVFLSKA